MTIACRRTGEQFDPTDMTEPCCRNERNGGCDDDADRCRPKSSSRGADGAADAEYAADCCAPTPIVPTPLPVDADHREKPCKTKDPERSPSRHCPDRSSSRGRPDRSPSRGRPDRSPSRGRPDRSPSDCRARPDLCCVAVKTPRRAEPTRAGTGCCAAGNDDCVDCDLTDYAREYVANTGRLVQSCACIKFNGLQDSCRHSGCAGTTRTGCMDNPFPSCLPAQKWKCDFMCKNKKKPDRR